MTEIILIAAVAANGVIGQKNATPWHIPEELHFFKQTTMGHPVLMGRKTFQSLRGPLPGRRNIVISRSPQFQAAGVETVPSLAEAVAICQDAPSIFIIGGAQIFSLALPIATTLLLSILDQSYDGDTFFPEFTSQQFIEKHRQRVEASQPFTIFTYARR